MKIKSNTILTFIWLHTFLGCTNSKKEPIIIEEISNTRKLNTTYQVSSGIKNEAFNLTQDNYSTVFSYKEGMDSKNCECFYSNGLLQIKFKEAIANGSERFVLNIDSSAFFSHYSRSGHIRVNQYEAFPIEQHLSINTDEFQIGKPIFGVISFKGISFTHLMRDFNHFTVEVEGEFGCIPRKEIYSGY